MVGIHCVIALAHGGPVAVPDVPAYLSVSQWVVGVGQSTSGLQFHPGYGLLLVPAAAIVQTDGHALHTLALVLNAVAAGAVVQVAVRLAWLWLSKPLILIAVALLAALHPSVTAASRIAWPETLLVLLTLSIGLCLATAWGSHNKPAQPNQLGQSRSVGIRLSAAGLLTGLAFSLHPRALVLTLALGAVVFTQHWVRKSWLSIAAGLSVGWLLSIIAVTATSTWPSQRVSAATSTENGFESVATAAGQLISLAAGTAGLALMGLVVGVWITLAAIRAWLVTRILANPTSPDQQPSFVDRYDSGTTAVAVFFAAGAVAVIILGGWVLAGSARADTFLYGRYVDPWAIPLSVIAICSLNNLRKAKRDQPKNNAASSSRVLLWDVAVFAIGTAVVVILIATQTSAFTPGRRIMTLSLSPIWSLTGPAAARDAVLLAMVLVLAGVTLFAFSHLPVPQIGLAVFALTLFSLATVSNHRHLANVGDISAGQVETVELAVGLSALDGVECLAYDADTLPGYVRWLYQLQAPQLNHESVSFASEQTACGPLVIARPSSIQQYCPNADLLAKERLGDWGLWRLHEASTC